MNGYSRIGIVDGLEVKVIKRSLTKEESRRIFKGRPHSRFAESRYGGDWHLSDEKLVAQGKGVPCAMCNAVAHNEFLIYGVCPDCDGRAEASGKDPYREVPATECCGGPCREGQSSSVPHECCGAKEHHSK